MNNNISNFLDDDFKRALINHCKTFKNYEYPKGASVDKIFIVDSDTGESYTNFDKIQLKDDYLYMEQYGMQIVLKDDCSINVCPMEAPIDLSVHYTNLIDSINKFILDYRVISEPLNYMVHNMADPLPEYFVIRMRSLHNVYMKEDRDDRLVLSNTYIQLGMFGEEEPEAPEPIIEYNIPKQKDLHLVSFKKELYLLSSTSSLNYCDINEVISNKEKDSIIEYIKKDYNGIENFNLEFKALKETKEHLYNMSKLQIVGNEDSLLISSNNGTFNIFLNMLPRFITKYKGLEFPEEEFGKW